MPLSLPGRKLGRNPGRLALLQLMVMMDNNSCRENIQITYLASNT